MKNKERTEPRNKAYWILSFLIFLIVYPSLCGMSERKYVCVCIKDINGVHIFMVIYFKKAVSTLAALINKNNLPLYIK